MTGQQTRREGCFRRTWCECCLMQVSPSSASERTEALQETMHFFFFYNYFQSLSLVFPRLKWLLFCKTVSVKGRQTYKMGRGWMKAVEN